MSVVVVGLEHRQAPLSLLERVVVGDDDHAKVLGSLRECANLQEAVLLSTCLRTEVYAVVDRFHDAVAEVEQLLASLAGTDVPTLRPYLGVRFDEDVPAHLLAVASGLESAVVGESEVLGQVRRAWERAQAERVSGPVLARLFLHAVHAGRRVRSETGIARGTTSFAHAAVELVDRRLPGGLTGTKVLVVGAGHMGAGLLGALTKRSRGGLPAEVVLANRSVDRAQEAISELAGDVTLRAAALPELPELLSWCDVAISAVHAPAPLVGVDQLVPARASDPRPLLLVDLGMPRNIEPQLAGLPQVTLVDMEDLRSSVDLVLQERLAETEQARVIVTEEVERYREDNRARGAAPVVASLRSRLEELRVAELERRRRGAGELTDAEWERVDSLTRAVLAKVLHEPTMLLKETAGTARGERLVEALRILFDL